VASTSNPTAAFSAFQTGILLFAYAKFCCLNVRNSAVCLCAILLLECAQFCCLAVQNSAVCLCKILLFGCK
jgi:hypothetical protein